MAKDLREQIKWLVRQVQCLKKNCNKDSGELSLEINNNILSLLNNGTEVDSVDLSSFLDDTNLPRIVGGSVDNTTGIGTFVRDDNSTFDVDFSSLIDLQPTNTSDLTNDGEDGVNPFITAGDIPAVPEYTIDIIGNQLKLYKDLIEVGTKDLSIYLDDTNLARLVSGVFDNNTGIATFTRDDNSTFTLDLSNLTPQTTFSDEDGNIKYESSEDKRTGYYDTTNEVYYPDIKIYKTGVGKTKYGNGNISGGSTIDDAFFKLSPKDASYMTQQQGGSGTGYYCLKFPNVPKNAFSFELDVQGNFDGGGNTNFQDFCRVRVSVGNVSVSGNVSTWSNAKIEFIDNSSDIDWEFYLADDDNGNLIVAVKQKDITSSFYMNIRINNLILNNVWNSGNEPLDFYTGWEGFTFNTYYGFGTFRIRETFVLSSGLGGISFFDENSILIKTTNEVQTGENIQFNATTNDLSVKTENTFVQSSDFTNGWGNLSTNNSFAGYSKIGNIVFLSGIVTGGALGDSIFTLPIDYRPTKTIRTTCIINNQTQTLYIDTNGTVFPAVQNTVSGWVSLTGVCFIIE